MYRAKAQGKARHAVFDAQMHRRVLERLDVETDLRRAIEAGSLQVLYQPILRTATGDVTAFEALCRWEVATPDFVAIAEETGLIVPLGRFVLREATRRAAAWGRCVSVNVSARQLADPDFTSGIEAALRESGARPADLRLEVTESAMTQDPEHARRVLTDLRDRVGVSAHLDDFGTGASSLRFLHRFPGDALKIDRGLVIDMLTDAGSHEIVKAIVGLAHNLGMEVVGEGVETAEHLERSPGARGRARAGLPPRLTAHRGGGGAPAGTARRRAWPGGAGALPALAVRALGVADVVRDPLAIEAALVLAALLVLGARLGAGRRLAPLVGGVAAGRVGHAVEAVALVVVDQLVVGQAALVHRGALVAQVRLRALALGLLLRHARLLLGDLGTVLAVLRLGAMLVGDGGASRVQLALRLADDERSRACAAASRGRR